MATDTKRPDAIELRGWGFFEQSFLVRAATGIDKIVTLDRKTTEWLGRELLARAERMEDRPA